jgi:hypothetical protein
MEDILALVLIFGGGIVVALGFSPIGKAVAERIRGRPAPAGDAPQLAGVVEDLEQVRRELAELQERMDFTERLLAKTRDAERLPRPQR